MDSRNIALAERAKLISAIRGGLKDIKEGKVHDARQALEKLRAKLEVSGWRLRM